MQLRPGNEGERVEPTGTEGGETKMHTGHPTDVDKARVKRRQATASRYALPLAPGGRRSKHFPKRKQAHKHNTTRSTCMTKENERELPKPA